MLTHIANVISLPLTLAKIKMENPNKPKRHMNYDDKKQKNCGN